MKPQTPGRGFFYALMMEETGNFLSGCPGLYTQIFRGRAGSWSIAYTVYSIFQGPSRFLVWSVYKILEKTGPRAEPVYTNFQDPGRFLVDSVYRKLETLGSRAESVYSKIQGPDGFRVWSVYKKLEKPGSGQNQYTQIFRAQASSWSIAYTESSKSLDSGRICILKFSELGQASGRWRIQHAQRARAPGEICILKNSGLEQVPSPGRIQKARKVRAPGRLQIDQFYARLSMQAWFHI